MTVFSVKYSRGSFIFPSAQPAPHRSFSEEVTVLNGFFGKLASGGRAYVMGDPMVPNRKWHVYFASNESIFPPPRMVTLEMCMTGLNSESASVFFKKDDGHNAKQMTKLSGISDILPEMEICDFEFDPCGYSMNGIHAQVLSTVHVTPEDGFSYASYEVMGFNPGAVEYKALIERVLRCFKPAEFSVAITVFGGHKWADSWGRSAAVDGYASRSHVEQEIPGGGFMMYQCYASCPNYSSCPKAVKVAAPLPKQIMHCWEEVEESEMCCVVEKKGFTIGEVR
ncbi:S-adenosylmethionine decarboxylase proenzyme [Acorus gramineus]|uniref:S-adenosylmethionine decarboxylase proenzyme n=1 Tax=Acorus gramineus TaxID=55184 RepID=A0AAV9BIP7_ACOGR|nr:S-adenosylmethionine decarboxylase proenzyme [Acorus gramineus]